MTKLARLILPQLTCGAILVAASLPVQETSLQIDPTLTKVGFTVADVLHTVHGSFVLKRGNIRFDLATGKASGELVVDATSGASGSELRDRRMNHNVLDSGRYPDIVFRPDRVQGRMAPQGTSQVELHGALLIHGAEHEIVVPVQVEATGSQYAAVAHFAVPYVKWGMKNPSTLFLRVSDQVDIDIQTVARPSQAADVGRPAVKTSSFERLNLL